MSDFRSRVETYWARQNYFLNHTSNSVAKNKHTYVCGTSLHDNNRLQVMLDYQTIYGSNKFFLLQENQWSCEVVHYCHSKSKYMLLIRGCSNTKDISTTVEPSLYISGHWYYLALNYWVSIYTIPWTLQVLQVVVLKVVSQKESVCSSCVVPLETKLAAIIVTGKEISSESS